MKVSLFVLALVCAVALCTARGLKKRDVGSWKSINWQKVVQESKRQMVDPTPGPTPTPGYDDNDSDDMDLDDLYEMWEPKPVTPEMLNEAARKIKGYLPKAQESFRATEAGVAEYEQSGHVATSNESLHGLYMMMDSFKECGDEAAKAYFDFYNVLMHLYTGGFSWEKYNTRLHDLTFQETARRVKEGLPLPTEAEWLAALRGDLAAIRDEIASARDEMNKMPVVDAANPPAPVFVVREIAAIQYVTDKLGHDVMGVVTALWAAIQHHENQVFTQNNDVVQQVRSLIESYKKLRSANVAGTKRAMKLAQISK